MAARLVSLRDDDVDTGVLVVLGVPRAAGQGRDQDAVVMGALSMSAGGEPSAFASNLIGYSNATSSCDRATCSIHPVIRHPDTSSGPSSGTPCFASTSRTY